MKRLLLVLLIVGGTAIGEELAVPVFDFSAGLNTVQSDIVRQPGAAHVVVNWDLTERAGGLTVRRGYDSLLTVPGMDSLLWNNPIVMQYSDGSKEMLLVGDSADVGYANVYACTRNTIDFGVRDSFYFYVDWDTLVANVNYNGAGVPDTGHVVEVRFKVTYGSSIDSTRMFFDTLLTIGQVLDSLADSISAQYSTLSADKLDDTVLVCIETEPNLDITCEISGLSYFGAPDMWGNFWQPIPAFELGTAEGGYMAPDRIATYVPATGVPQYAMLHDQLFVVNGVGRGFLYDGRYTQAFPMYAPGEVAAIPMSEDGTLNGRYRYALKYAEDSYTSDSIVTGRYSYLSQPVVVDSGQVLLCRFPPRMFDTLYAGDDSITYEIWRSAGDIGLLDKLDSMWFTGLTVTVDSANYSTVTVTDTISDDSLRSSSEAVIIADGELYSHGRKNYNGLLGKRFTFTRPGAPAYAGADSIAGYGIWDAAGADIGWSSCAGFAVMCVAVDTFTNQVSDSSPSFIFYQSRSPNHYYSDQPATIWIGGGGDSSGTGYLARSRTAQMSYVLPRLWDTSVVLQVYRGPVEQIAYDSVIFNTWPAPTVCYLGTDFHVPHYYLLGLYNPGDTVLDTLHYDSLLTREPYERNDIPAVANAIAVFDNQLFLADGSRVQRSNDEDTTTSFLTFAATNINPDDGDQITAMWPAKQVLRTGKTKRTYSLYSTGGSYDAMELSGHYGVVAPLSHANAAEGDYFLSHDGVRLEDEGIYKERSFIGSLVSGQIGSFREQPLATLRQSVGEYYDGKYLLSIPSLDTTWVLHRIPMPDGSVRYAWGTWSFTFSGAALYSVGASNQFVPSDSLYFTKPGGSSLYRYGSSTTDAGAGITAIWESGPLGRIDGTEWQVRDLQLWVQSTDTTAGACEVTFYNERYNGSGWGSSTGYETVDLAGLNDERLHWREVRGLTSALYWRARLTYQATGETTIDGLRVRLSSAGPAPLK